MRILRNVSKKVAAFSLCGIMITGLAACGAKANDEAMTNAVYPSYSAGNTSSAWSDGIMYDEYKAESELVYTESYDKMTDTDTMSGYMPSDTVDAGYGSTEAGTVEQVSESARKTIKTAYLNLQTLDFDAFATALNQKVKETGSYMQYADVYGNDYYGGRKSADYTVRVPAERLDEFLAGIEGIATVTNKTLGEEDVTLSYVDTESRIKSLEIEQERLFALLEKADNLEYIIQLEARLSEVRYSIESYQARLRTYDDKITYSTVRISVYEVNRVTEKEPETVWERIQTGWSDTMYEISMGAQDILVWAVVNLPYLVFWGVILAVLIVVLKNKKAKRLEKKLGKQSEKNETEVDHKE